MKNHYLQTPTQGAMKRVVFCLIMISSFQSNAQFRIRQEVIKERGFDFSVVLAPTVAQMNVSELNVSASVISSQKVDSICKEKYSMDGYLNYTEYSFSSKTYKLKRRRRKAFDEDQLLKDALEQLRDSGNINMDEYNALLEEIMFREYTSDKDLIAKKNGPIKLNPFRIDNKPFTTLQMKVINGTSKTIDFIPSACIISDGSYLRAYTQDELLELYPEKTIAAKILQGLYAEKSYSIPPNTSFTFLLAFPPIESKASTFDLYLNGVKQTFQVNRTMRLIEEKNIYYPLQMETIDASSFNIIGDNVYGICTNNSIKSWFYKNEFYVDKNELQNTIEILVIGISNKRAY